MTLSPRLSGVILSYCSPVAADLNGDGYLDLLFGTNVAALLGYGDGAFNSPPVALDILGGGFSWRSGTSMETESSISPRAFLLPFPIQPAVYRSFWEWETGLFAQLPGLMAERV